MGLRIRFEKEPDFVPPKTDGVDNVPYLDLTGIGTADPSAALPAVPVVESGSTPAEEFGSQWSSLTLNIDLDETEAVVEGVKSTLEGLDKITGVFVTVLKVLRIFSSDLRNISRLLKLTLNILVKQLKEMI